MKTSTLQLIFLACLSGMTLSFKTGPPEINVLCPVPEEEFATLLPNPDDCSTYYSCSWGTAYLMDCPKGLFFDVNKRVCTWPSQVVCYEALPTSTQEVFPTFPETSPSTSRQTIQPETTAETEGEVVTGPPEISRQCPIPEDDIATLLPNPVDCSTYYACSWGVAFLMQCPTGLLFDSGLKVCTWPQDAKCIQQTTTEHATDPYTSEPTYMPTHEPVDPSTPEPIDPSTPETVEHSTTELVEQSTSEPVEPSTHEPIEISTPEPVEPSTTESVYPSTPEPLEPSTPESVEPSSPEPIEPSTTEIIETHIPEPVEPSTPEPVEPSTTEVIEPSTSEPIESSTPEPMEPSTLEPVDPSTPEPIESSTVEPVKSSTLEPFVPSTTEVIEPSASEPVEYSTPEPIEPPTLQPTVKENTNLRSALVSNQPECPPVGSRKSYLPNPKDCTSFFVCSKGEQLLLSCPEGTFFDSDKQVCNHEAEVECEVILEWKPKIHRVRV